jgi:hypothetical protein
VAVVEQDHRNMLVELDLETVVLEPITVVMLVLAAVVVATLVAVKVVVTLVVSVVAVDQDILILLL